MTLNTTMRGETTDTTGLTSLFDRLYGIEAIDKFIALEFANVPELESEQKQLWAVLLVALSFMQRNGHSCLSLAALAGQRWFNEPSTNEPFTNEQATQNIDEGDTQEETASVKAGVLFPALTPLIKVVKNAFENSVIAQLFVYQDGRLYSRRYFDFEQEVAKSIVERTALTTLNNDSLERLKALWPKMFPTENVLQQDWQQVAVAKSLVQRFSVINGGPGTGKTYTVLRLLLALQALDKDINIVLAAPTGKAQQRMTESIISNLESLRGDISDDVLNSVPTEAVTIHRLLGLREHTVSTKFGFNNALNLDVLIVDEASMVDLALMARIMRALPAHAKLYFIGDADQLPAVELGNVLEQLVDNTSAINQSNLDNCPLDLQQDEYIGAVPSDMRQHIVSLCPHLPLLAVDENAKTWVSTLQAPQRFKGQVAEVATAIQQGDVEKALLALTQVDKSEFLSKSMLNEGVQLLLERASTDILKPLAEESFSDLFANPFDENGNEYGPKDALAKLNEVRWLTPMRRGPLGVEGLNSLVFDVVKKHIKRREGQFYQGQPIMIVKNHHPQRLSNGEVGVIWPNETGKLFAWFESPDGGIRHISLSRVPQFETVFAMTIHKSQGSEFKHVVLVLSDAPSDKAANLLHRGLVYTGLTRAKEGCLIVAEKHTLSSMIEKVDKRFSGLSETIQTLKSHMND